MLNGNPFPNYGIDILALSECIGVPLPASDYPYEAACAVPWLPDTVLRPILDVDGDRWVELCCAADDALTALLHGDDMDRVAPFPTRDAERACGTRFLALASEREHGPEHFRVLARIPSEREGAAGLVPTVIGMDGSNPYETSLGFDEWPALSALGNHLRLDLSEDAVLVPCTRRPASDGDALGTPPSPH